MILAMTKYHENLLKDSTLSLLSIVNFFPPLGNQDNSKDTTETLLTITRKDISTKLPNET